jgi:hypothetical protein
MRYRFIERERIHYPVTLLCQALAVPRSGYYAWRQRGESPRAIENLDFPRFSRQSIASL